MNRIFLTLLFVIFLGNALHAKTFLVSSEAEMAQAMLTVQPDDEVVWKEGSYADVIIDFCPKHSGTLGHPITLRAQTAGKAVFTGASQLFFSGSYLVASGLLFSGTCTLTNGHDVVSFAPRKKGGTNAEYCRLTNCAILNYTPTDRQVNQNYIGLMGRYNEVDHCSFEGKTNQGPYLVVRYATDNNFVAGSDAAPSTHHHIHHNYFGYRTLPSDNGGEDMRIGDSKTSFTHGFNLIEYNYFEEHREEAEVISNKSWNNVYRFNTFYHCDGALVLRHGQRCFAYGNYFDGGSGRKTSGGIRAINPNQTLFNNYMDNLEGGAKPLKAPICIMDGLENSAIFEYFPADSCVMAFNTVVNSVGPAIRIGVGNSKGKALVAPKNVLLVGNLFINSVGKEEKVAVLEDKQVQLGLSADNAFTNGLSDIATGFTTVKTKHITENKGFKYLKPTKSSATTTIIHLINSRLAEQQIQLTEKDITTFNPAWKLSKTDVGVRF